MKNKYITRGLVGLFALCGLASCSDDYLDVPYYGVDIDEAVFKTVEGTRQGLLGVCGRGMSATWSTDFIGCQDMCCGENGIATYYGELTGADCYYNRFNEYGSGSPAFYDMSGWNLQNYYCAQIMWNYCYSMLSQVNEILNNIDAAEGDDDERNFTKGQALTMRAHLYFRLLQCYAPRWEDSRDGAYKCVVLRLGKEDQIKPLAPMKDILTQCYNDLDKAIECFKNAGSYERELDYEPTLNVAYGVYARIAALKNDWQLCREMAHNARQGYKLATEKEMFGGYCEYNKNEWLWSASFILPVDDMRFGNWCTSFAANGYRARRSGASMRINKQLYNQIPDNDKRRNWWFTADKTTFPSSLFYNDKFISPVNMQIVNVNLSKACYAWLQEHTPAGFSDAYVMDKQVGASEQSQTPCICDGVQVKYFSHGLTGDEGGCKPPYMRATEMWLLEAEAIAELALQGKAAAADAQALLEEINNVPTDGAYKCTATGKDLIDEVRLYRRVELWGEGFNWFDLKRWSLPLERKAWVAGDVNSGNLPANICNPVQPSDKRGWVLAFPRAETNYNTAVVYPFDPFN